MSLAAWPKHLGATAARLQICSAVPALAAAIIPVRRHSSRAFSSARFDTNAAGLNTAGQDLARAVWRLAHESQPPAGAWEALDARAAVPGTCTSLRGHEIVCILHACNIARRHPKLLLARLAEQIPDSLPQISVGGLCICIHTYAQVRSRDKGLFAVVTRHVLHESRTYDLEPVHLVSLLYSHARALFSDRALFDTASQRLAKEASRLSVDDIATALQVFATMRVEDADALQACAHAAAHQVGQGSLVSIVDAVFSLSRLDAQAAALQNSLARRCETSQREFKSLTAHELVRVIHGLGAREDTFSTCCAAADLLAPKVACLEGPKQFVQAMDALAHARMREDTGPCVPRVRDELLGRLPDLSLKDVIVVAKACQPLQLYDGAVLEGLVRQAIRKRATQRFKKEHRQARRAVLDLCAAGGFEHTLLEELKDAHKEETQTSARISSQIEVGDENLANEDIGDIAGVTALQAAWPATGAGAGLEEEEVGLAAAGRSIATLGPDLDTGREGARHRWGKPAPTHRLEGMDTDTWEPVPRVVQPLRPKRDKELEHLMRGIADKTLRPVGWGVESVSPEDAHAPSGNMGDSRSERDGSSGGRRRRNAHGRSLAARR